MTSNKRIMGASFTNRPVVAALAWAIAAVVRNAACPTPLLLPPLLPLLSQCRFEACSSTLHAARRSMGWGLCSQDACFSPCLQAVEQKQGAVKNPCGPVTSSNSQKLPERPRCRSVPK